MSYEVIKRRGNRAYRYLVEYYHDENGKGKTRWHYQGPVDADSQAATKVRDGERKSTITSGRLLDALERLLAQVDYSDLTASAIAREAGVAHGTFYRHFHDKRDALRAVMVRLSERAEHLGHLADPGTDRNEERRRIRDWATHKLSAVREHPGVWRAWITVSEGDPEVSKTREQLRSNYRKMLQNHFAKLNELGHAHIADPVSLSCLIFTLMYGILQDRHVHRDGHPSPEIIEHALQMIDRAIFAEIRDAELSPQRISIESSTVA